MTTSILLMLFDHNQTFDQAMKFDGDTVLEMIETKLDESLSSLEEDKERLARKEIAITKEHGSVKAMRDKVDQLSKQPSVI